jgi:uncharacterized membrane protein
VSAFFFIAIVCTNHHYLLRFAREATPRLVWFNFAHLFSMSLSPLATAWMATSELAPQPVSFYAALVRRFWPGKGVAVFFAAWWST